MTRFLGYLGVISAVLFILPLIRIPIVQVYWLGALAALFMGRMRGGLTPAWLSGEAVPWPSPAEMRDARVRAAEERRGGLDPDITVPDDASSLEQDGATAGAAQAQEASLTAPAAAAHPAHPGR